MEPTRISVGLPSFINIHIGFGLAKCIDDQTKYDYSKIKDRVIELGLERLVDNGQGQFGDIPTRFYEGDDFDKELESRMWTLAESLTKKSKPKPEDVKNALNFLEVFTFFAGQSYSHRHGSREDSVIKALNKSIKKLEELNDSLKLPEKNIKSTAPALISQVTRLIDKEFSSLSLTEQKALSKTVARAKDVLTVFQKNLTK